MESPASGPDTLRARDALVAAAGLVGALPVLAVAAAAIRLEDGGPVLFRQERVGLGGRTFTCHKLRTMRDGNVTRVGRMLRELGLDELPQLYDVVRGEMSLVGPRPLTREDLVRLGWDDEAHALRHTVRPGLTGPAQLRLAGRCDARVTWLFDRTYVKRRSMRVDAEVIGATLLVLAVGKRRARRWLLPLVRQRGARPA